MCSSTTRAASRCERSALTVAVIGLVYSGQVNGDFANADAFARAGRTSTCIASTKTTTTLPRPVFAQYDPVVTADGTVYFQRSGNGCGAAMSLIRYPLGGPATVLYSYADGIDGGYGYIDEKDDGSLDWIFGRSAVAVTGGTSTRCLTATPSPF